MNDPKQIDLFKRPRMRGPRGMSLDALIFLGVAGNPRRWATPAWVIFQHYRDGITVREFLTLAGKKATANLKHDATHGYIVVDGYEPLPKRKKVLKPAPKPVYSVESDVVMEYIE